MNRRRKGKRQLKKTHDWLGKGLWSSITVEKSSPYGSQDCWGADILAVGHGCVLAIQVKSNELGTAKKDLMAGPWHKGPVQLVIVVWRDYQREPIVYRFDRKSMEWVRSTGGSHEALDPNQWVGDCGEVPAVGQNEGEPA